MIRERDRAIDSQQEGALTGSVLSPGFRLH